jgi:CHAD domain-containing protein
MGYRLEPYEPLAAGLQRAAGWAAESAAARLEGGGDLAKAAHEARKHGKEARAALRLLRSSLPAASSDTARGALREANRLLAAARDAEAMIETLDRLRQRRRLLRRERRAAEEALERRRAAAVGDLDAGVLALAAAGYRHAAAALADPPLAGGHDAVLADLARLHRRGGRRMAAAVAAGTSEAFHEWRRDAKDLWYAFRLFAPAWPGPLEAVAAELQALGRALGEEHDLAVLGAGLAAGDGLLTDRLARALQREQVDRRVLALGLGARLWAERPRQLAGRLVGYHRAWLRPGLPPPR